MSSESQKKASAKYDKANTVKVTVKLNRKTGKPKNWIDGLYKGVKPYGNLEIIKKGDFIPESPVRIYV